MILTHRGVRHYRRTSLITHTSTTRNRYNWIMCNKICRRIDGCSDPSKCCATGEYKRSSFPPKRGRARMRRKSLRSSTRLFHIDKSIRNKTIRTRISSLNKYYTSIIINATIQMNHITIIFCTVYLE